MTKPSPLDNIEELYCQAVLLHSGPEEAAARVMHMAIEFGMKMRVEMADAETKARMDPDYGKERASA